jgi:hypothetical protein
MDDFQPSNLYQSRDELCARLVNILNPLIIEGIKSIFNEAVALCIENNEIDKYLMTFQNLLSRVVKWNSVIVEEERKRIIEKTGCNYLEDLMTCVHIIQLKLLTCIRVGTRQKKIDISIPKLDTFIHKIYIQVARKTFKNVYLFERNITPLQVQKNEREFEIIVNECILNTIRDSIPTEEIIRAYTDESVEVEEEVLIENIPETNIDDEFETEHKITKKETEPIVVSPKQDNTPAVVPSISNINNDPVLTTLKFNDFDSAYDFETGNIEMIEAPKTIERLEELAFEKSLKENEEDDSINERLKIHTDKIDLNDLDILDLNENKISENVILDDIEEIF